MGNIASAAVRRAGAVALLLFVPDRTTSIQKYGASVRGRSSYCAAGGAEQGASRGAKVAHEAAAGGAAPRDNTLKTAVSVSGE